MYLRHGNACVNMDRCLQKICQMIIQNQVQRWSLCTWKSWTAISMRLMHSVAFVLRALRSSVSFTVLIVLYCPRSSRTFVRPLSSPQNASLTSSGSDTESSRQCRNLNTVSRNVRRVACTWSHSPLHASTSCKVD